MVVQSDPRLRGCSQDHEGFGDTLARTAAEAVIALGYPDQFPFLYEESEIGIPCFLWSQFSRVPQQALSEQPVYVPLTGKTAYFLRLAGCSRIGPIIPHGVNSRLFRPISEPGRSRLKGSNGLAERFVVGSVGNNSRRKRFDLVIRSFALFAQARQNARLMIKTDRPVSLDGVDLPALIAREGISDRVEVIAGQRTDQELVQLYNLMDLYLNLSEWEGFCIPVIPWYREAWCGKRGAACCMKRILKRSVGFFWKSRSRVSFAFN
jgi:glycosyltransferase involved in cell wall biosynthesis